jgi:hypothetical protein
VGLVEFLYVQCRHHFNPTPQTRISEIDIRRRVSGSMGSDVRAPLTYPDREFKHSAQCNMLDADGETRLSNMVSAPHRSRKRTRHTTATLDGSRASRMPLSIRNKLSSPSSAHTTPFDFRYLFPVGILLTNTMKLFSLVLALLISIVVAYDIPGAYERVFSGTQERLILRATAHLGLHPVVPDHARSISLWHILTNLC